MPLPTPEKGVGKMQEVSSDTGQVGGGEGVRPAGVWKHPVTGIEAITQNDPLYGDVQGRAFQRAGFEFIREVEPGEVRPQVLASESHASSAGAGSAAQDAFNREVLARLNASEAENARLKSELASGNAVPGTEPVVGAEETKAEGASKVTPAEGSEGEAPEGPAEPVAVSKDLSRTKLEEVATAEGLTDLEQYQNKANLVEAIENHRKAGNDADTNGGNE